MKVRNLRFIKENVLLLDLEKEILILKNFTSSENLAMQLKLMKRLKDVGFNQAFEFYEELPFFNYDGKNYVFLKYIRSSTNKFHFQNFSNREQGLKLLSQLHDSTKQILKDNPNDFDLLKYNQIEKWEARSREFQHNVYIIQEYVNLESIQTYVEMGKIAIQGMKVTNYLNREKNVIIHGDVANHNFIRDQLGKLHIIDFDLMAIAPSMIDLLQYANRILSFCHFDAMKLMEHNIIADQMKNQFFLYALLFPTDIFREWNRLIREKSFVTTRMHEMKAMTENELNQRVNFYFQIETMIK